MSISKSNPITVISEDPEIIALQGMVFGIHHFDARDLSMRHFKLIIATELSRRVFGVFPTKSQVAVLARIKEEEMEPEFNDLLERRYLHENVPAFGDITYKLGSMGGTLIRHMLKEGVYETPQPKKATSRIRARRSNGTKRNPKGSRRPPSKP